MRAVGAVSARLSARGWPIASAQTPELILVGLVDLMAIIVVSAVVVTGDASRRDVGGFVLLLGIALGFEEFARRAARMTFRLGPDLKRDTASVWAVAGAIALPPVLAVALVATVRAYIWLRQQRPAGEKLYRKWFSSHTEVLGALLAGFAVHHAAGWFGSIPISVRGAVAVVIAITAFSVVNRALVTLAIVSVGGRGRALLGSLEDNLIELATLCLGGLVSLAALYQPWLAFLVIAPMYALQRGALVRELETAAMTDNKTGLLNAAAWEQFARREIQRAERQSYGVAVLIIDIDRFKSVNDRFGHLVGDKILHQVARTMTTAMRDYDTVGRFGGEEFVAVLPDVDVAAALTIAERTRARVAELRISRIVGSSDPIEDDAVGVSIGVAMLQSDGTDLSDLLHSADRALYDAKASGRNCVRLAVRGGEGTPVTLPFA